MDQSALQWLIDRAAISDTILAYATGVDGRDWALYRSIFTDMIDIDFSTWSGLKTRMSADAWVAIVRATLSCFDATQHNITNHVITVNGDEADITANMIARHSFKGELQSLGGFYTHHLLRASPGWKIAACKLVITWEQGDRTLFDRARLQT
jgi:3-phenylpropionate/cinnamic acid dioxygenase small subunit